jgi:hypothetical protein
VSTNAIVIAVFNTTATLRHTSELPAGVTVEQCVAALHDHSFFMHCNPIAIEIRQLAADDPLAQSAASSAAGQPPAYDAEPLPGREVDYFQITDVVPNSVWKSHVESTYVLTDVAAGAMVKIHSPLGIMTDTLWEIKEREDGRLELVENVLITCSRLLIGTVKAQTEKGWPNIHANILKRLEGIAQGQSESTEPGEDAGA